MSKWSQYLNKTFLASQLKELDLQNFRVELIIKNFPSIDKLTLVDSAIVHSPTKLQ